MITLQKYLKTEKKPQIIVCGCGSRYSSKLKSCPGCGLVRETEEEIENWRKI